MEGAPIERPLLKGTAMPRNRYALLAVLLSALVCTTLVLNGAPQAFFSSDLTIHQTETSSGGRGAGRNGTSTTYLSGNAVKRSGSDGSDVIIRLDEGKMILVDNNKKTYSEMTFQEMQAMMDKASDAMKNLPPEAMAAMKNMMGNMATEISVTSAGPGETIAGYATEKYLVKGPMEMEIWAAPALKVPPQFYDAIKMRMPRNPMFDLGKLYDEMKKINGWPVKQITTLKMMGQEQKSESVVTSVDKTAIPKATFDVPAGYKKTEMTQPK
jgi:hypothetical protein